MLGNDDGATGAATAAVVLVSFDGGSSAGKGNYGPVKAAFLSGLDMNKQDSELKRGSDNKPRLTTV